MLDETEQRDDETSRMKSETEEGGLTEGAADRLTTLELEEGTVSRMGSGLETHEVVITKEFGYKNQTDKNSQLREHIKELGTELNKARDNSRRRTPGKGKYKTLTNSTREYEEGRR